MLTFQSGACAGTSTDLVFFPIDTIKTRLQAKGGFFHNGGWRGIYKGLGSCVVGSAPSASLFFVTYDSMKRYLPTTISQPVNHMISASLGEIAACLVRVPVEVIKQRTQTGMGTSSLSNFKHIITNQSGEGVIRGLYRGWNSTIMREIPFTVIQFPLYEYFKKRWSTNSLQSSLCGSLAGGIAAAVTTPLDVIKTRIMLSKEGIGAVELIKTLVKEEGYGALFRGIVPRTCWISAGGAIFLGCYEVVHTNLSL